MATVSYAKLWKKMEEQNMSRTDLYKKVHISTNAQAKLGRDEDVRVNVLVKICDYFGCTFDDIVEIIHKQIIACFAKG